MNDASWPPPATANSRHREVLVRRGDDRWYRERGRVVKLWGRDVVVDQAGDVYCPGCGRWVPAAELGRPDNRHQVGVPSPAGVVFRTIGAGP
jgi:hypothetical protein